jgi:hypothetical protein
VGTAALRRLMRMGARALVTPTSSRGGSEDRTSSRGEESPGYAERLSGSPPTPPSSICTPDLERREGVDGESMLRSAGSGENRSLG